MAKREYQTTKINYLTIIGEERATYKEQRNNQRPRKKKTWVIGGVEKPRTEWCEEYGKSIQCVLYRITKMGLTPEMALKM